MTEKRRVKIEKVAKAVVEGKTITQAGLDAGYSPKAALSKASTIVNSPEGKAQIDRILDAAGLDEKGVVGELKRGLARGKMGSHLDYLDRVMDLRRMINRKSAQDQLPTLNLFMNFAGKLAANGVIQADGTVKRIDEISQ